MYVSWIYFLLTDKTGTHEEVKRIWGVNSDGIRGMVLDSSNNIHMLLWLGAITESLSFGQSVIPVDVNSTSVYIAKISAKNSLGVYLNTLSYVEWDSTIWTAPEDTFVWLDDFYTSRFEYAGLIDKNMALQSSDTDPVEVFIPKWAHVKTEGGTKSFYGEFKAPELVATTIADELQNVVAVMKVWNDSKDIWLKDEGGQDMYATIRIPVQGMEVGDEVDVLYSLDGNTWNLLESTIVISLWGKTYVEATTNHFTHFAVTLPGGQLNYDVYVDGHKASAWTDVVLTKGESQVFTVEYNNASDVAVSSKTIKSFGHLLTKDSIPAGEAASVSVNTKAFKTYPWYWKVQ